MRPRFSLRVLLLACTALALACYWRARPAALARQFVNAVQHGDYEAADHLFAEENRKFVTQYVATPGHVVLNAERRQQSLLQWLRGVNDVWLIVQEPEGAIEVTYIKSLKATAIGLR